RDWCHDRRLPKVQPQPAAPCRACSASGYPWHLNIRLPLVSGWARDCSIAPRTPSLVAALVATRQLRLLSTSTGPLAWTFQPTVMRLAERPMATGSLVSRGDSSTPLQRSTGGAFSSTRDCLV